MDYKTILAPTDFSSCSRHAIEHAVALARRYGAEVALLHVYELPTGLVPTTMVPGEAGVLLPLRDHLVAEARRQLLPQVDELQRAGVTVHPQVAEGRAADAILRAADELNADLIVMGTHGRTGLGRMLIGSVTEHVIRHAGCPVYVVREPSEGA
jgi:nucleotide-binding universal stress UspA family protein